jgi:MSHA biogenesis protein MshO
MAARSTAGGPGFTLVELVIAMVIASIMAGLAASFITRPMEGYADLTRRAALVDAAEGALRRMARDIHAALPNSLRIAGGGTTLELLHTADGGRYRRAPGTNPSTEDHTATSDWLDFAGDSSFNLLGRLGHLSFSYGSALAAQTRLAIYTTTTDVYADAAADANPGVITPSTASITILDDVDEDQLVLSSSFDFLYESPRQRVYLIDTPLTYRCDLAAATLVQYAGYAIASAQPTDPALSPLSGATAGLLARNLSGCSFSYEAGTLTRAGLLTLELSLADGGETVRLLHQVHVDNPP